MIDLVLDDEQRQIETVAHRLGEQLAGRSASSLEQTERRQVADLGVFGIGLRPELGGVGAGARGEVVLWQALGTTFAPVGLLGATLAAQVLSSNSDHDELVARLLAGDLPAGLAIADGDRIRVVDPVAPGLITIIDADHVRVADVRSEDQLERRSSIDDGAELADVVGELDLVAMSASPEMIVRASLLPAAMAAGVAADATRRAVAYAKDRQQFGKPIGTFQAVQHRCVDMAARAEAASSIVRLTAARLDAGDVDAGAAASCAVIAVEAARENAASVVQVFGGLGFTAESGLQHLIHRAWLLQALTGGTQHQLERVIEQRRRAIRAAGASETRDHR